MLANKSCFSFDGNKCEIAWSLQRMLQVLQSMAPSTRALVVRLCLGLVRLKEVEVRLRACAGCAVRRRCRCSRSGYSVLCGLRRVVCRELRGKVGRQRGRLGSSRGREVLHDTDVRILRLRWS